MDRLIFDIETAPLPEAVDFIEPTQAPSNYKDPDKINAYIEGGNAAALGKCALDPDLCRVVAIGWWIERRDQPDATTLNNFDVAGHVEAEARMLNLFWAVAGGTHLVGYNCLAFDLPVLLRRSLYLGIKAPAIQIDKYRHPQVTDLMSELSFNGAPKFHSLSFYAKRMGIDVPDAISGADIGRAVTEGRWNDIEAHVRADVQKTAAIAERLGHFSRAVREEVVL